MSGTSQRPKSIWEMTGMTVAASELRTTTRQTYPRAAQLQPLAPLHWVREGIDDFRSLPALSLVYGTVFAALCASVFRIIQVSPWYTVSYLTALLAIGPFLASGLYVASRELRRGSTPSIAATVKVVRDRKLSIAVFSLILALVMAASVRLSALALALKLNLFSLSPDAFLQVLSSPDGWVALLFFVGIGLLVAAVIFTISAVAVPLIVDKDTDFITAMQTSYRAVMHNRGAMFIWASVVIGLTAVGIATAFLGFALIFPVLAYATWHSYCSLVA
jgi:uncharacterized membrane protein